VIERPFAEFMTESPRILLSARDGTPMILLLRDGLKAVR
jgi:hypothetical protein